MTDADSTVVAYKAGTKLFGRTLVGNGGCVASRLAVTRLSMGVGGTLWATAREANYNCPGQSYLFALSATSGNVQVTVALGGSAARWMQATATGAVVLTDAGQGTLRYFNAAGAQTATQPVQLQAGESVTYPRVASGADGTVYLPVMREHAADANCNQGNLTTTVLVYGASGKKGAYQLPNCASIDHLAAGSWGAALYGVVGTGGTLNGVPAETLITISATGTQLATGLPKNNVGGSNFIGGATRLLADAAGNLVVLRKFTDANGYDDTLVQITEPTNGTVRQEFTTESFAGLAGFTLQDAALGKGYVYLLGYRCEGANSQGCPVELHGIAVGGLELEAPFGDFLTAAATPPAELEFAFAGDSFISGEGVKPFGPLDDDKLCHRSEKAWPRLADADPKIRVKLQVFTACSGAKSSDIRFGSSDQPKQMDELKGAKPKRLVISIGGNDIGFSKILLACVLADCKDRDRLNQQGLKELPKKLEDLVADLRANLGDSVQLYFMGYPRVLPADRYSCNIGDATANKAIQLIKDGSSRPEVRQEVRKQATEAGLDPSKVDKNFGKISLELNREELLYANDITVQLNKKIQQTVTRLKNSKGEFAPQFIDATYSGNPFAGRTLCPKKGKPAFSPIFVDILRLSEFAQYRQMWVHPNLAGVQAYEEVFRKYILEHPQH